MPAALELEREIVSGDWRYNRLKQVSSVRCDCGQTVYKDGLIHARLVDATTGSALCRSCKRMVRIPIVLAS
jgi:hypothetical protein